MKNNFSGLKIIILIICAGALFCSCSLAEEYGTLIVNLPGSDSAARALQWEADDCNEDEFPFFDKFISTVSFRVECNAPGVRSRNAKYGDSLSMALPNGSWNIMVTALNAAGKTVGKSSENPAIVESGKANTVNIDIGINLWDCELTNIAIKINGKSCSIIKSAESDAFTVVIPKGLDNSALVEFSGVHTGALIDPHFTTWDYENFSKGISDFGGIRVLPAAGFDYQKIYTLELAEAYFITNAGEWDAVLNDIASGGDGTSAEPKNYYIDIQNEVSGVVPRGSNTFGYAQFINVFITGNGNRAGLNLVDGSYGSLLNIGNNQTVSMQDLVLKGIGAPNFNSSPLVNITSNGTFIMDSGSISDNNTFGEDSLVDGGAVFIGSGGAFTMNGCNVSGNYATRGGGVFVTGSDAIFTMNGGAVSGNSIFGGHYAGGGGVYVADNGIFIMTGGEVSNNITSSDFYNHNYFGGGGVYVAAGSTLEMSGGKISGNSCSWGGGVYLVGGYYDSTLMKGTLTMSGGEISDNIGTWGAGVYIDGAGEFTMNGNSKISGNKANGDGGGVEVSLGGAFTMNNGEISGNEAGLGGANAYGGGVYVHGTTFTMNGGKISGNKTNGPGGGVYVLGYFYMTNGVITGFADADANRDGGISSAALYKVDTSIAEYGTYSGPGGAWNRSGSFNDQENSAIRVVNGNLETG